MAYAALIDKQVNAVFNKVKDLAVDATFTKTTSVAFDFNAGAVVTGSQAPVTVKLVPIDQKKPSKSTNTIVKTVMAKAADLGDLASYDTFTFHGFTWKLGDVLKEGGRVWVFQVFREA